MYTECTDTIWREGCFYDSIYTGTVYLHYTLYTLHAVCNKVYTVLTNMERWEDFPTKNNKNVNYLFSLFKIIESSLDRCIFLGTNMMSLGDSRYYSIHNLTV